MPITRPNPFAHLRESAFKGSPTRSVRWYQDQIRKLGMGLKHVNPQKVMTSGLGVGVGDARIGNMVLFYYDPKTKERLPHWDTFPLVIPFRMNEDGFHGVNLHYLNPYDRMAFLNIITTIQNSGGLSWEALNVYANRFAEHCVKRYLYSHVKNQYFLKIGREDWKTAIMLPVEQFQKQSKYTAWL